MPSIIKFGHLKAISLFVGGKPVTPIAPQEAPSDLDRDNLSMKVLADAHEDLVLRLAEAGILIPTAAEEAPAEEAPAPEAAEGETPQGETPAE